MVSERVGSGSGGATRSQSAQRKRRSRTLPPEELISLADELGSVISRAYMAIRRPLFQESVSFPRMRMLSILLDNGPQRISQLAYADQVSQPSLTLMVDGMEQQGWLERRADPTDGRAVLVALTPDGEAEIRRVRRIRSVALAEVLEGTGSEFVQDLDRATRALNALVKNLTADHD